MSLVIAIKDKDRIVLGADKQVSAGDSRSHTSTKIWQVQELPGAIMGSVGSARASQIIQYIPVIDKNLLGNDNNINTEFVICSLAPTIAAGLKANGVVVEAANDATCELMPNAFIFAYKDNAWMIWNDMSVTELTDYLAIGSGSDIARGVLYATEDKNPFERIVTSIDAAAEATLFVDHGIDLLVTKNRDTDEKQAAKALGYDLETLTENIEQQLDVKDKTSKKKTKNKK